MCIRDSDHDAYGNSDATERHEVCRQVRRPHDDEGDTDRKRDSEGNDQAGPQAAHESEQHQDDKDDPLHQRGVHRVDAAEHQLRLVVVGHDAHAFGERIVDLVETRFDVSDDLRGVGPNELEHEPRDDLPFAVLGRQPLANLAADLHPADVAHFHRYAVGYFEDGVLDVGDAACQADRAHQIPVSYTHLTLPTILRV